MKIAQINIRFGEGGAASIARALHQASLRRGHESQFLYGYGPHGKSCPIEKDFENVSRLTSFPRLLGNYLCHHLFGIDICNPSPEKKKFLLSALNDADIIHLHAIHSHFISYRWLLSVLGECEKPIVWTMHDSWVLTGRCAIPGKCLGWQNNCIRCQSRHHYPSSLLDLSRIEHSAKKKKLERLQEKVVYVAISDFMFGRIQEAYPKHRVVRIPNGIDETFEKAIPAVSSVSTRRKVLLVGADLSDPAKVDHPFIQSIIDRDLCELITVGSASPFRGKNVRNLGRIYDRSQMACLYSEVDASLFTSTVDNYPLTMLESLCVGTPVLAYHSDAAREILSQVGSSPLGPSEITDLLKAGDLFAPYAVSARKELRDQAQKSFSSRTMIERYFALYESLIT